MCSHSIFVLLSEENGCPDAVFLVGLDFSTMPLESFHLGLTHILFTTCSTSDAIYQIGISTRDLNLGVEFFACGMACDCTTLV